MDPRILVKADYWLGVPLCALLTGVRRLRDALGRPAPAPPRKILFIKLEEQGALVLAADAFRRAAELVGPENVYCCLFEKNRPILDLLHLVRPENVLTIDTRNPVAALASAAGILRTVRRLGIDSIVDLEGFARMSAAFTYLCGGTRRVGTHRFTASAPYRGDLMTHRVAYSPYLHAAAQFSVLVEALAAAPGDAPLLKAFAPELPLEAPQHTPRPEALARVRALLPPGHAPLIIFTPNSSDILRLRKWPIENYISVGRTLREVLPGCTIVFTGLESERADCAAAARAIGLDDAANLAGALTLEELCALFTLGDLLLTNDSGPGHFAAMTDIHQVILFGPETPQLYRPLGTRVHVLYHALACSPCLTALNHRISPCQDNQCVKGVTTGEVLTEIEACLRQREQSGLLGAGLRGEA